MELMVAGLERSLGVIVSERCSITVMIVVQFSHYLAIFLTYSAVVSCGSLSVTTGASGGLTLQFSAPTATFGTRAVYSCSDRDYQLVGRAERMCGSDGNWTGGEPHCEC